MGNRSQVKSITLTDPNINRYVNEVISCSYKNGTLRLGSGITFPTTLVSNASEDLHFDHQFDTVVMMNVLEHAINALDILRNLYNFVKPGGLLIFHGFFTISFYVFSNKAMIAAKINSIKNYFS